MHGKSAVVPQNPADVHEGKSRSKQTRHMRLARQACMHLIWQSSLFWRTAPQVRTVTAISYLKLPFHRKRAILSHTWSSSEGIFAPTKVMFTQPCGWVHAVAFAAPFSSAWMAWSVEVSRLPDSLQQEWGWA